MGTSYLNNRNASPLRGMTSTPKRIGQEILRRIARPRAAPGNDSLDKGLGSPRKTPVLKGRVQSWLAQKKEVLAFVQARPAEGGAGALVVLLQPSG